MQKSGTTFDKPCALYHRVSSRDQDKTLARRELRQAATARGLAVALDIEEKGTGRSNDRPGLQRVLEAVRRGEVGAVLVWKLDRFGRSTKDLLRNIEALNDAGVRFVCTSQGLDIKPSGDAVARLTLTVLAAVAEFESELISERTRLGQAAAKARGVRFGRPPSKKGPTPTQVRELRADGLSWSEIGRELRCTPSMACRRFRQATAA